jgi:His-Xaa-Ser system protein HxsD
VTAHELRFECSAHTSDAIQRAAYRFSDRLSCDLVTDGPVFRCTVHLNGDLAADAESVIADFRNEVLDQTLRERIRGETEQARNLILALAFSKTGLVDHRPGG